MGKEHQVLIVAATPRELVPVLSRVESLTEPTGPRGVRRGRLAGRAILVATCGVGKSNAAMHTLDLLRREATNLVINTGCAGAYPNKELNIGDVVVGSAARFADEGVLTDEGFLDLRDIGMPLASAKSGEPIYNTVPVASVAIAHSAREFAVRTGVITTVSLGSARTDRAMALAKEGLAEAMEGAAVALAAHEAGCAFVEVRGISNETGVRDLSRWDIDLACEHAADIVEAILTSTT